jgi:DNA replication protein DnaC
MRMLSGEVKASEALVRLEAWRAKAVFGGILVLSGQVGCGKTFAASKFVLDGPCRAYPFEKGWPASSTPRFVGAGELQSMGLFGDRDLASDLRTASVLAIDDLGTEFYDEKGAFQTVLDGLLDCRYRGVGFTVITTNLPLADVVDEKTKRPKSRGFASRYGRRLVSRLEDDGCGFVHLKEPSFRTANRKAKP